MPILASDGYVEIALGEGQPEIVCAQLQLCFIDLQPMESVLKPGPIIGDSARWKMDLATSW